MDDILDSPESDQVGQGKKFHCVKRSFEKSFSDLSIHGQAGSGIMRDWILVAAGIERFFFLIYTLAFALVTSIYM